MSAPHSVSAGEVGGLVAGAVALLGAIGGGLRWLFRWMERRASSRAAKLQAWHDELERREAAWEARQEHRLAVLEGENRALRLAFALVSAPLRAIDPDNPSLAKAEALLAAAFPLFPAVPPEMSAALGAIAANTKERMQP